MKGSEGKSTPDSLSGKGRHNRTGTQCSAGAAAKQTGDRSVVVIGVKRYNSGETYDV